MSLRALTKKRTDGRVYARRPETAATLLELIDLSREDVAERLAIGVRDAVGYVPNECLVYLLRAARSGNDPAWFDELFSVLDRRVRHNLARTVRYGSVADPESVREEVLSQFRETLGYGLGPEPERLDPFEVMFDGALASLRKTHHARQRLADRRKAEVPTASDGEGMTGEPVASAPEDLFGLTPFEYQDFRTKALASIDRLPEPLRETVHLACRGDQAGSTDPDKMTIAKLLDVDERTVHNRIKRAVRLIRVDLGERGR